FVQTQTSAGNAKSPAQHLRKHALATHALAELTAIEFSPATLLNQTQHMLGAIGKVLLQPLLKQIFYFQGQAQKYKSRAIGASIRHGCENTFHFFIVNAGN